MSQESGENDDIEGYGIHNKNRKNVKEKNIPSLDTKDSSGSHDEETGSNFIEYGQSELPPLYIDI